MSTRYSIRHVTQFTYDDNVSESVMEVRMQPMSDELQQCLQFAIDVQPRARVFSYRDFHDNWVHHFNVPRRHRQLQVTARAYVDVQEGPALPPSLDDTAWRGVDAWGSASEHWDFTQPSQFAQPTPALLSFLEVAGIGHRSLDPLTTTRQVMAVIHENFEYAPNSTRVDSPLDEAIATRRGVCQDFTHVMIAALRHLSLPARYVSGYIAPAAADASPSSIATHAWAEVCLPGLGWIGFDPTHNTVTRKRHVRVAIGRDYADVPPTRGMFRGTATSALGVSVEMAESSRFETSVEEPQVLSIRSAPTAQSFEDQHAQQQQ